MPDAARLADISFCPADTHGCPIEPHPVTGPAVQGSGNVLTNNRPALRLGDMGIHAVCCNSNTWKTTAGSKTVFINDKKAVRKGDKTKHCGGNGSMKSGSSNVTIGDSQKNANKKAGKLKQPCVFV